MRSSAHSWLQQINVAPEVKAFATSRGALCDNPYGEFNVCHYTGDDPLHVEECRHRLREATGIADFIIPRQTHSVRCLWIDALPIAPELLEGVDALVTDKTDIAIGINTADCVPVLLCDPDAGVIGAAHAGWRGAVGGILEATVSCMVAHGAHLSNIRVATGAAICADCFEVGEEVAAHFPEEVIDRSREKPHADLPRYVSLRLQAAGIPAEQIKLSNDCTRCAPDRYFSARAMGISSGRNFTFIAM